MYFRSSPWSWSKDLVPSPYKKHLRKNNKTPQHQSYTSQKFNMELSKISWFPSSECRNLLFPGDDFQVNHIITSRMRDTSRITFLLGIHIINHTSPHPLVPSSPPYWYHDFDDCWSQLHASHLERFVVNKTRQEVCWFWGGRTREYS